MINFGLIGKSLIHSFSPGYFNKKFKEQELDDHAYLAFEIPSISKLPDILKLHPGLKGLNVTIPYKQSVLHYLHVKHQMVDKTGACNCIKIADGKLHGFNTDVNGFYGAIKPLLLPHHKQALILGSGGSSKAVAEAFNQLQIEHKTVSREVKPGYVNYEDLDEEMMASHTIIVNTTPLGMFPEIKDCPPVPYQYVSPRHLMFDLIYNPAQTIFLKKGEEQGAVTENGYNMLVLQAEESWKIWNA